MASGPYRVKKRQSVSAAEGQRLARKQSVRPDGRETSIATADPCRLVFFLWEVRCLFWSIWRFFGCRDQLGPFGDLRHSSAGHSRDTGNTLGSGHG